MSVTLSHLLTLRNLVFPLFMADELSSQAAQDQSADDLTKMKAQCEEYLAGWKRAQADYANALRERDRDRSDYVKYANTSLLQSLLPVIEHFATALRHIPSTDDLPAEVKKKWESWLVGLKAVQSLWEQAAQSNGLERITAQGAFDPNLHEAVGREPSETVPADHIVRVMRDGWKLNGKVLQPAHVIVAEAKDADSTTP